MLVVTTPSIKSQKITEYKGLVTGDGMLMVSASGTAVVLA